MAIELGGRPCFRTSKTSLNKKGRERSAHRRDGPYVSSGGTANIGNLFIFSMATLLLTTTGQANADTVTVAPTVIYSSATGQTCTAEMSPCYPNPAIGTTLVSQTSAYASASATADLSKAPSISAVSHADLGIGNVDAPELPTSNASSEMVLRYEFRLVGPSGGGLAIVPFHFVASGSVEVAGDQSYASDNQIAGNALGQARLQLERNSPTSGSTILVNQSIAVGQRDIDSTGHAYRSFDIDQVVNLSTVSVFDVYMQVKSFAAINPNFPGPVTVGGLATLASIDPYLYIDPAYADRYKDYSVVFSGGIVNSLTPIPTPLPAGAPLFATALLALSGGLVRKRGKTSTVRK